MQRVWFFIKLLIGLVLPGVFKAMFDRLGVLAGLVDWLLDSLAMIGGIGADYGKFLIGISVLAGCLLLIFLVVWLYYSIARDVCRAYQRRRERNQIVVVRFLYDLADMIEAYSMNSAAYRIDRVPYKNRYRRMPLDELKMRIEIAIDFFNDNLRNQHGLQPIPEYNLSAAWLRVKADSISRGDGDRFDGVFFY